LLKLYDSFDVILTHSEPLAFAPDVTSARRFARGAFVGGKASYPGRLSRRSTKSSPVHARVVTGANLREEECGEVTISAGEIKV
jgi:hypothetical protein